MPTEPAAGKASQFLLLVTLCRPGVMYSASFQIKYHNNLCVKMDHLLVADVPVAGLVLCYGNVEKRGKMG